MAFEQVNSKVVRAQVAPGQEVLARRGAMLGYEGQITFRPIAGQGQGVGGMVGRAMSGESNPMMATEGTGSVLYGFRGLLRLGHRPDRRLAHGRGRPAARP